MTARRKFPVLDTEDLKRVFPDLEVGDILEIHSDDLDEVDIGQYVVIQRSADEDRDLALLTSDELPEVRGSSHIGAHVSGIGDAAVTLEVVHVSDKDDPPEG
ncbi:hypothetical protein [Kribbella sp. CA-294648]|uniref:hypothetical protein n=1 Tax=Kribbella sp. CA-294648 TaxID=3239948 RepID=UPI003D9281DF